jgi:hypothetical protein
VLNCAAARFGRGSELSKSSRSTRRPLATVSHKPTSPRKTRHDACSGVHVPVVPFNKFKQRTMTNIGWRFEHHTYHSTTRKPLFTAIYETQCPSRANENPRRFRASSQTARLQYRAMITNTRASECVVANEWSRFLLHMQLKLVCDYRFMVGNTCRVRSLSLRIMSTLRGTRLNKSNTASTSPSRWSTTLRIASTSAWDCDPASSSPRARLNPGAAAGAGMGSGSESESPVGA